MTEAEKAACRRNSWAVAAVGGVLVALMLLFVAQYGFLKAVFFGLVFFVALGAFLVWSFCSRDAERGVSETAAKPHTAPTAAGSAAVKHDPAPVEPAKAVSDVTRESAGTPVVAESADTVKEPRSANKAERPERATTPDPAAAAADKPGPSATGLDAALAKSKGPNNGSTAEFLDAPRDGVADDLKMIKGVGPALEKALNGLGVWHFDQIASWTPKDVAHVDSRMEGFRGRVTRDEWVKQARLLAKGGQTEFSERVAKGDVY